MQNSEWLCCLECAGVEFLKDIPKYISIVSLKKGEGITWIDKETFQPPEETPVFTLPEKEIDEVPRKISVE